MVKCLRQPCPTPGLALAAVDRALAAVVAQSQLLPGQATAGPQVVVSFAGVPLPSEEGLDPIVDESDLPRVGERGNGSAR